MTPESLLPRIEELESDIVNLRSIDVFGSKVLTLAERLKRDGERGSSWLLRLLLFEKERRFATQNLINSWISAPQFRRLPELTAAPFIDWSKFIEGVNDLSVKWSRGSYRSIPTPMHVLFLSLGMTTQPNTETNVLLFEPAINIQHYKNGHPILDDRVRYELLSHIPGLDAIVKLPYVQEDEISAYWDTRKMELSARSRRQYELVAEDTIARGYAERDHVMGVWSLWEGAGPEYWNWSTSVWDEMGGDYNYFNEVAIECLVE